MSKRVKRLILVFIIFTLCPAIANAGIALAGTRLIYDANKNSAAIDVLNTDAQIYLIQSWIEGVDKSPAPFVLTPPLFKINKKGQQSLRIINTQSSLPSNKESLFWLNVKAIPLAEQINSGIQVAVKTRIKLIYRPKNIREPDHDVSKSLKWSLQKNTVTLNNPTPYYINFYSTKINETPMNEIKIAAPFSTVSYPISSEILSGVITWTTIDDYGAKSEVFSVQI